MRLIALTFAAFLLIVGYASLQGSPIQGSWFAERSDRSSEEHRADASAPAVVDAKATVATDERALSAKLMCFNVNSVQVPSWHSASFLESARQLRPKVLRVPGGEVANYWDWERGGIIEDDTQLPDGLPEYMRYDARSYTNGKLTDYQAGLQATNSTALFVLNMLTSDLADQIDMLSTAAKSGMEIKYVELGNEYYFGIPNYAAKFPTPELYGEEAKVWIGYLRDIFPGVKIAVFGTAAGPQSSERELRWNQALLETALPDADAIALHIYAEPGLDPDGFSTQSYPAFDEGDFATIFGEPFRHWSGMRSQPTFKIIPPDKEIWITEFNLIEDIFGNNYNSGRRPRVMGTWSHGLYALAMNLMFLEEDRVTMTCNHDLVEDFKFGAILPYANSFYISDEQTFPVTPMTLSATGQALQLLGETVEGMTQSAAIKFANAPQLTGKDGYEYSGLYGWQFQSLASADKSSANPQTNRSSSIVLNLSDRIVQLEISEITADSVDYQQLSADPRTLVTSPYALTAKQGSASNMLSLPPHSVTRLMAA